MAELFLAIATREAGFEKVVVVKRVLPHLARDEEFVSMFLDEARLAATLDHPNIAHVMDFGRDGDSYYYVMEYIQGLDVRALLKRAGGPLPVPVALSIVTAASSGLHYAHERLGRDGRPLHLVHRDVSPSNIFVSVDGAVKVLDFGIAKAATAAVVTASGVLKGKLGYMSPEQCRGEPLDRRSDVFGLGVVLYQLITGRRPFATDNYFATLNDIQKGRFAPPSDVSPNVPPAIESIIMRAMAGVPEDRYATVATMSEALEEFALERRVRLSDAVLRDYMAPLKGELPHPRSGHVRTGVTEVAAPGSVTSIEALPAEVATQESEAWTKNRIRRFRRRVALSAVLGLPAAIAAGWMVRGGDDVDAASQQAEPTKADEPTPAQPMVANEPAPTQDPKPVAADAAEADLDAESPPEVETKPAPQPKRKKKQKKRKKPSTSDESPESRLGRLAPPV